MKLITTDTYEEMSEMMTAILLAEMTQDKRTNLSITAGSSPKGVYELLAKWYKKYAGKFGDTYFYNFDEIVYDKVPEGITISALQEQFLTPAGVPEKNIRRLTLENYAQYDEMIREDGGLDVMMIGLGGDGHFCGNMPVSTDFSKETHKVYFKEEYPWYKDVGALFGGSDIPEFFVTMGFKSLLKVKHLVLIVNGKSKAEILKKALSGEVTPLIPGSVLKLHPNFTVIADKEAASLL